jgi:hypothetical protein
MMFAKKLKMELDNGDSIVMPNQLSSAARIAGYCEGAQSGGSMVQVPHQTMIRIQLHLDQYSTLLAWLVEHNLLKGDGG